MKILFATLHSRYSHSSLALPSIASCIEKMDGVDTVIREMTVREDLPVIADVILAEAPDVLAFSCYIWNIEKSLEVAAEIGKRSSGTFIVLGGPEVSFDAEVILKDNAAVDCIVRGEGEAVFRKMVHALKSARPLEKVMGLTFRRDGAIINNPPAHPIKDLDSIPSPFAADLVDIKKPLVYYETSRGCPFTCAFCLSSLDSNVRSYSMERIKKDLTIIMQKKGGTIKFVDRTFNFNADRANEIWRFILESPGSCNFHFEIAADLLTESNLNLLEEVPPDTFRFEIGVQSIAEETLGRVARKSDMTKLFKNVGRLIEKTNIKVHLDLVAGLPGEDFEGFLSSLQRLFETGAPHIQVEPLKVLKGSPMEAIAAEENYSWSSAPPYRISETPSLDMGEIELIDIMGRLLEIIWNSGRFPKSLEILALTSSLSLFFEKMAERWRATSIVSASLEELFDFVWLSAKNYLPAKSLMVFADALIYDRCMAGFPSRSKVAEYFALCSFESGNISKEELRAVSNKLDLPLDKKVRLYKRTFGCNFIKSTPGPVELLFVYITSHPGGQEVKVVPATEVL